MNDNAREELLASKAANEYRSGAKNNGENTVAWQQIQAILSVSYELRALRFALADLEQR